MPPRSTGALERLADRVRRRLRRDDPAAEGAREPHDKPDGPPGDSSAGVTQGCDTERNYCPDDPVTRGQMAAFLNRALGLSN